MDHRLCLHYKFPASSKWTQVCLCYLSVILCFLMLSDSQRIVNAILLEDELLAISVWYSHQIATKIKIILVLVFEMDFKHMIELNSIMAY